MRKVLKRISINKDLLLRTFASSLGWLFSLFSIFLAFFSFDDLGIQTLCYRFLIILGIVILACICAVVRIMSYSKRVILSESTRSITLRYGNLWSYAFSKKCHSKRIVIISVNTTFDTIVDPAGIDKPLVSENTIHGQWINQMEKNGVDIDEIDRQIDNSLKNQNIVPLSVLSKTRGKCNNYSKGTIAYFTFKDTVFYLLALSEFDENNNVHNSIEELRTTINKMIDYLDKNGQGLDVYMPLMGTGKSRTYGITDRMALELIKSELLINKEKLHGNINVIVYEGDKDKISLGG